MLLTTAVVNIHEIITIEDSPEPIPSTTTPASNHPATQIFDPKDPEGFLKRCSGYNKKKGVRCGAAIGRNSHHAKNCHSTFLPTCYAHKDQQSYAGWCQFLENDGEKCGKLFRWTPPYFELCAEHQGHPDTPCYFLKLPLELRLEVVRYLLPSKSIGSSTALQHREDQPAHESVVNRRLCRRHSASLATIEIPSVFPTPLLNLLLVNRQVHDEVKDLLYSIVPFTVDVRKDGTFMCGRRLLEPRRADGSSHYIVSDVDKMKEKFLKTFNWAAVKNYDVDILVENWKDDTDGLAFSSPWDEEVEIYDIRDYIGVVVSGILSKSRNLCKLNVRLGVSGFQWTLEEFLANIKTLVGPFERLRNVRQPRFRGIYQGTPLTNFMISLPVRSQFGVYASPGAHQCPARPPTPLCSVPKLPTSIPSCIFTDPIFLEYRSKWEHWTSSVSTTSLVPESPIRAMFTELKEFYTRLAATVPDVTARNGRGGFLHQARVAREQENVQAFRFLRNELIGYWEAYLEQEERKKEDMNRRLSKMLDADVYPASFDEDHVCVAGSSSNVTRSAPGSSSHSPVFLGTNSRRTGSIPRKENAIPCKNQQARSVQAQPRIYSGQQYQPQASSSAATGSVPTVIMKSEQRHEAMLEIRKHQQDQFSNQYPVMSGDAQLQPSFRPFQDQQPTALNPQPNLGSKMMRLAQMEDCKYDLKQEDLSVRRASQPPQSITLPTMPSQQLQESSPTTEQRKQMHLQDFQQSSSFAPANQMDQFPARAMPRLIPQRHSLSSTYHQEVPYVVQAYDDPPHADSSTRIYEGAQKRASPEVEKLAGFKKQRVDSGLGWGEEDNDYRPREVNENGDEVMVIDGEGNHHDQSCQNAGWNGGWCAEKSAVDSGKGKGKGRADDGEVAWRG